MLENPGFNSVSSPVEVQYSNDSTYTFKIEKCSDANLLNPNFVDPECADIPKEIVWRVWIETALINEPRNTMNDLVSFDVVIGDVCKIDTVSFDPASLIGDVTYTLRNPTPEVFYDTNVLLNDHWECPIVCTLTLPNDNPVPAIYGVSDITGQGPFLQIETGDKNLNNMFVNLKFTCASVLSEAIGKIAQTSLRVTYVDECYDSEVYAPIATNADVWLYETSEVLFTPGSLGFSSCGPVFNNIISVSPDDANTPPMTINDVNGSIVLSPDSINNLGQYTVVIETCIVI